MKLQEIEPVMQRLREDSEKCKVLGRRIQEMVRLGESERAHLEPRWDALSRYYRGENYSRNFAPYEGSACFNVPMLQPKLDGLCAQICSAITSSRPYFMGYSDGGSSEDLNQAERTLQFFLERSSFSGKVREAAQLAALYGRGVLRASFDSVEVGIKVDAIHPADFVCYPAASASIETAQCAGHRFRLRTQEVRERQLAGVYWGEPDSEGSDETEELWSLLVRLDLDEDGIEERYEVTLAASSGMVLSLQPYPLSRAWYFAPYFRTEFGSFWHSGSVGHNLQGLQVATNELWNLLYDGAMMSAFPTQFASEGTLPEASIRSKPGDVVPVMGQPNVQQVQVRFDGSMMVPLLQMLDQLSDVVSRMPRTALGQQFRGAATATEISALQSAYSTGLNEYAANFGEELGRFADLCWELICRNSGRLMRQFSAALGFEAEDIFAMSFRWELNGRTPTNTPGMRYAMAERLLSLAGGALGSELDVRALLSTMVEASELPNAQRIMRSPGGVAGEMDANGSGANHAGAAGDLGQLVLGADYALADPQVGAGATIFGDGVGAGAGG